MLRSAARIAVVVVLVLGGTVGGLEVQPPNPVPPYQLVRVTLDEGERAWVLGQDFLPVEIAKTTTGLVFVGPPGKYAVLAFSATTQDQRIVVISGDAPDPDPDPGPDPDPPDPVGPWNIVLFYDSTTLDNLTSHQQAILRGEWAVNQLQDRGHTLLRRIQGHPTTYPTSLAPFVQAVKGKSLPRVALQAPGGGTVYHYPLPDTWDGFISSLSDPRLTPKAQRK